MRTPLSDEVKPISDEEDSPPIYRPSREPDYPPIPEIDYCRDTRVRSGGFGLVYKAKQHNDLARYVAVKVTHLRTANAGESLKR